MTLMGLNPFSLSKAAGVGETYVHDLLRGRTRNPRLDHLQRIAIILGCTVQDLIDSEPPTAAVAPRAAKMLEVARRLHTLSEDDLDLVLRLLDAAVPEGRVAPRAPKKGRNVA